MQAMMVKDVVGEEEAGLAEGAFQASMVPRAVRSVSRNDLWPRHVGTDHVVDRSYCDEVKTPDQTTNTTPSQDTNEEIEGSAVGGGGAVGL